MSECFSRSANEHVSDRINENHPNEFRMALWQAFQAKVESKAEADLQAIKTHSNTGLQPFRNAARKAVPTQHVSDRQSKK